MNWDGVIFTAMISAGWMFAIMLGMQLGIRVERWRRDKEVEAFELPDTDERHWKKLYEELAEEWNHLPQVFPADHVPERLLNEIDSEREAHERRETA